MDYKRLADLLFGSEVKNFEEYINEYKRRDSKEGEEILRFAPSPTGFIHMGSLYTSFIAERFAHQSGGKFVLRIEDTDQKREVENGTQMIIDDLTAYDYKIDEGPIIGGNYGPYIQSQRKDIYVSAAKYIVSLGRAYPCFCTEEKINEIRKTQKNKKDRIGYYGSYAKCRNLSYEEVEQKIKNNESFVIRLKSMGDFNKKLIFKDLIKGKIEFPENDLDHIILKSDKLPPYAFAHVVDDYLMGITTITRADEYVSSIPYHLELWEAMNLPVPPYAHIAPINKREGTTLRKISKRKDPECAISYYTKLGIPVEAIKLYLATLLSPDFEMWYTQNSDKTIEDFKFEYNKMSVGGSLFDLEKLISIAKIYFSKKKATVLYDETLEYTKTYDEKFYNLLLNNKDYSTSILNIEREIPRPRKDISCYSDVRKEISYMFDELFSIDDYKNLEIKSFYDTKILEDYFNNVYNNKDEKEIWWNKIKEFSPKYNFSPDTKEYKNNPEKYKGHIGDICELIRVSMTGRTMTPDLYEILKLLDNDSIKNRIKLFESYLKK